MSDRDPHPIDVSAKPEDRAGEQLPMLRVTSPSSVQSIHSSMNIPPMTMDDHEASPWDGNISMNTFASSILILMPRCPLPKHQPQPESA